MSQKHWRARFADAARAAGYAGKALAELIKEEFDVHYNAGDLKPILGKIAALDEKAKARNAEIVANAGSGNPQA